MEAKELKIGNWVTENGRLIHIHDGFGIDHAYNFEPIPLTEEWLLKFGFEKKSGSEFKKDRFIYRFQQRDLIIEGFEYDYNGIICHPDYVHQLQNLYFALTNEELEVTPIPQT